MDRNPYEPPREEGRQAESAGWWRPLLLIGIGLIISVPVFVLLCVLVWAIGMAIDGRL